MLKRLMVSILLIGLALPMPHSFAKKEASCKDLEKMFGTEVEVEDGVCKLEITRKDLKVVHMGKKLSPETMELVFHIAFEQVDGQTAVMGEMALLEEEVNPVIDAFRKGNIEVSAVHNHMIHERPRVMYLHFQGIGDMKQQANVVKNAIEQTSYK